MLTTYSSTAGKYYLNEGIEFLLADSDTNQIKIYHKGIDGDDEPIILNNISEENLKPLILKHFLPNFSDLTARNWISSTKDSDIIMNRKLILCDINSKKVKTELSKLGEAMQHSENYIFGFTDSAVFDHISESNLKLSNEILVAFDTNNKNVFDLTNLYSGISSEEGGENNGKLIEVDPVPIEEILKKLLNTDEIKPTIFGEKTTLMSITAIFRQVWRTMDGMRHEAPVSFFLISLLPVLVIGCFIYVICFLQDDTTMYEHEDEKRMRADENGDIEEFDEVDEEIERKRTAEMIHGEENVQGLRKRGNKEEGNENDDE